MPAPSSPTTYDKIMAYVPQQVKDAANTVKEKATNVSTSVYGFGGKIVKNSPVIVGTTAVVSSIAATLFSRQIQTVGASIGGKLTAWTAGRFAAPLVARTIAATSAVAGFILANPANVAIVGLGIFTTLYVYNKAAHAKTVADLEGKVKNLPNKENVPGITQKVVDDLNAQVDQVKKELAQEKSTVEEKNKKNIELEKSITSLKEIEEKTKITLDAQGKEIEKLEGEKKTQGELIKTLEGEKKTQGELIKTLESEKKNLEEENKTLKKQIEDLNKKAPEEKKDSTPPVDTTVELTTDNA